MQTLRVDAIGLVDQASILIAAVLAMGTVLACTRAHAQGEGKYGGSVSYAENESVSNFNPYQLQEPRGVSDRLFTLIYDPLVTYDFDREEARPALAADWTPKGNTQSKTITFQLREGVTWHDGQPFTAEDVAFTFRYIVQAGDLSVARESVASLIESVQANPTKNTVTFTLTRAESRIAQKFSGYWIIPKHKFEQMLPKNTEERLSTAPVGTGPYRFVNRTADGKVNLRSYQDYWNGQPYIAETQLKRIYDPSTMYMQAVGGNVDIIIETPPPQIGRLEASNRFSLEVSPSLSFDAFAYDNQHPILGKKVVRRAFTYAVDRKAILKNFFADKGRVLGGPLVPEHGFFNRNVEPLPYDPSKARQLLEQAGYVDRDGDGTRETPDGTPLTFELITLVQEAASSTVNQNVATSYANNLDEVGVKIRVVPKVKGEYLPQVFGSKDFEIAWVRWEFDPSYDISTLFMTRGEGFVEDNIVKYKKEKVNSLFRRFMNSEDPDRRRSAIYEVQEIISDDLPYTFLYTIDNYTAINYKIISDRIDPYYFFSYYENWYMAPDFR